MPWWRGDSGARGGCWAVVLRARPGYDENEKRVVLQLSQARKAPRDLVMRARMVELSWSGQRVPVIADELRCSPKTVCCWLHRFNRWGLGGLGTWVIRAASGGSPRLRTANLPRRTRPGYRSGSWMRWPPRQGGWASRSAAARSVGSCWPRECAGVAPGPGCARRIRSSREEDFPIVMSALAVTGSETW
ncbi:helix-turn-helix domain-containing protein [Streptomyces sp. NPDC052013]|uniref:helix-turn-helix domain-containing protein n=1 Tax=Streptomyces sp. NPDC052013 TaxID=3365679 RepID=UPI0037D91485